jgi:predicted nucleotidyltransferase
MLNKVTKDRIVGRLVKTSQPEKIILFGSYSRGEQKADSDIDLFIIQYTKESPYRRAVTYRKALLDLGLSFDIIVRTPEEVREWQDVKGSFIHTVLSEGSVIYEK